MDRLVSIGTIESVLLRVSFNYQLKISNHFHFSCHVGCLLVVESSRSANIGNIGIHIKFSWTKGLKG